MAQRQYFRRSYRLIGLAATQPYKEDEAVPDGCELHYQRIVAENETTAASDVVLEVNRAGTIIPVGHILDLGIGLPKAYDSAEIVLQGEEKLRCQWAASANGDVLKLTLEGYLWDKS